MNLKLENRLDIIPDLNKNFGKNYYKKYNKLKNALAIVNKQKAETMEELDYIENTPKITFEQMNEVVKNCSRNFMDENTERCLRIIENKVLIIRPSLHIIYSYPTYYLPVPRL